MKKTIRRISVVAIAMALSITFSGVALASQPVCNTNSAIDPNDISPELKAYLDYWGVDASEVNREMFQWKMKLDPFYQRWLKTRGNFAVLPKEKLSEELKLSDYLEHFKENTVIMVGDNASQIEKESAKAIASKLEELTGNEPKIKEGEVTEIFKYSYNLIVLGAPDTKGLLQEVYGMTNVTKVTEEYHGSGKGVVEILRNPWNSDKALLIVVGSDEWGVKAGSEMLMDSEKVGEISGKMIEFARVEIADRIVYSHQRRIDDAIVEGDYIVYQFDKNTTELIDKRMHWRSDLPEHVTPVITKEEAGSMVRGEVQFTKLYIISPDSVVFPLEPTPENPCWVVRSIDNGSIVVTIIDAMNGKILGYGVPPPNSHSQIPRDISNCTGVI
jgi:hypothetical protein